MPLDFLTPDTTYQAKIYRDGAAKADLVIEDKTVTNEDVLTLPMLENGGFAVYLILLIALRTAH